ncbi:MAG: hypothetical protein ACK4M7_02045 [Burkholderiales bacterium]
MKQKPVQKEKISPSKKDQQDLEQLAQMLTDALAVYPRIELARLLATSFNNIEIIYITTVNNPSQQKTASDHLLSEIELLLIDSMGNQKQIILNQTNCIPAALEELMTFIQRKAWLEIKAGE